MNIPLPFLVAISVSILLMAATIVVPAGVVLRIRPLPYWQALMIAAVANLFGKLFVSVLHWPGVVSYTLPTIAQLYLSYVFFKPSVSKLLLYWIAGFALYLVIHLTITALFNWTFMFPFWAPRLLG
jgi:hypothetical protein